MDEVKRDEPMLRPLRATVESFQMLGAAEQRALVQRAQGQVVLIDDVERPSDLYR